MRCNQKYELSKRPFRRINLHPFRSEINDILKDGIHKYYKTFRIKKNSGGFRVIDAPNNKLKKLQRNLLDVLYPIISLNFFEGINGFVKNRNIQTNAIDHRSILKEQPITSCIRIDIKNAFGSTTKYHIVEKLVKFTKLDTTDAMLVAEIATYNDVLPQGSPLSPLFLNLCLIEADLKIFNILRKKFLKAYLFKDTTSGIPDFVYSRYADDINLSSSSRTFPSHSIDIITKVLGQYGYTVKRSKTRLMGKKHGIFINGINIANVNKHYMNISKKRRSNLRAMIHNASKETDPLIIEKLRQKIIGKISFIANLDIISAIGFTKYAIKLKVLDTSVTIRGLDIPTLSHYFDCTKSDRKLATNNHEDINNDLLIAF